jgi:hypothetical protein
MKRKMKWRAMECTRGGGRQEISEEEIVPIDKK